MFNIFSKGDILKMIRRLLAALIILAIFTGTAFADTLVQKLPVKTGFNFIAFSVRPDSTSTAQNLKANNSTIIDEIYAYSTTSGSFISASDSLTTLFAGTGYIIKAKCDGTLTIYGTDVATIGNINLTKGFNLVGFSKPVSDQNKFSTLMSANEIIQGLHKYNPASGSFIRALRISGQPQISDVFDPSFALTQAYFIHVSDDTTINYDNGNIEIGKGPVQGPFTLTSSAFVEGATIPAKYLGITGAANVSPALGWVSPTPGVGSFVILCEDLTVPTVHWALYNIPASMSNIPENVAKGASVQVGGVTLNQAKNYLENNGYDGPNPPATDDTHQYKFTIYCLKEQPTLEANLTVDQLKAITKSTDNITFGNVSITGTYKAANTTPTSDIPTPTNITYDSNSGTIIWTPVVGDATKTYIYRVYLDNATAGEVVNTASYGLPSTITAGSHTVKVEAMIKDSNPAQVGAKGTLTNNTFNIYESDKPFKYSTLATVTNLRYDANTQSLMWDSTGTSFYIVATYKAGGSAVNNDNYFLDSTVSAKSVLLSTITQKVTAKGATDVLLEVAATASGAIGIKSNMIPLPTATAPKYFIINGLSVPSVPAKPVLSTILRAPVQYDPAKHAMKVYDQISGTVYQPVGNPTSPASYMSQIPMDGTPKTLIAEITDLTTGNVLSRNIVGKCPIATEVPSTVKNIELKNVLIDEKSTALAALGFEKVNAMPNVPAFNYASMTPDANGLISKALAANELTSYAQTLQKNVGGESVVTGIKMAREAIPQITDGIAKIDEGMAQIPTTGIPEPYATYNNNVKASLATFRSELKAVEKMMVDALNAVPTTNVPNPQTASELIKAYIRAAKAQNVLETSFNTFNTNMSPLKNMGVTIPTLSIPSGTGAPASITLGSSVVTKDTPLDSIPAIISQIPQAQ